MDEIQNIVSLVLAALAIFAIFKWRDYPERVAASCLAYASCHFAYTVVYLLSAAPAAEWALWNSGEGAARIGGSMVLVAAFVAGIRQFKLDDKKIKVAQVFGISALLLFVGYAFNAKIASGLWVQDVLCNFVGLALCFLFTCLLSRVSKASFHAILAQTTPWVVAFIVVAALVGVYEIVSLHAWATYQNYQGITVYRASSVFFNPNWYGAWLVLVSVLLTYAYVETTASRPLLLLGMAFVGVGFFLSGSRAALAIAAGAMLVLVVLREALGRRKIIVCGSFCAVGFCLMFLFYVMPHDILGGENPLYTLAGRWTSFHMEVISLAQPFVMGEGTSTISPEFAISFHGRFLGAVRDNGFLAVFDDGGAVAAFGLALLWGTWAVVLGKKISRRTPSSVAYAFALFLVFTLWTVVARTLQVFPMWFVGAILVASTLSASAVCRETDDEKRALSK